MNRFNPPSGYTWAGEWIDGAADRPEMAHTSVVVMRDGHVVTGAASEPALVVHAPDDGRVVRSVAVEAAIELHGMTLVEEDGEELIWVADCACKLYGGEPELREWLAPVGRALQVDLEGRVRRTLETPPPEDGQPAHRPTGIAVDERRFGGSGDVWVADGYGTNLLYRYAADGRLLDAVSGEDGGRLDQPHDVIVDRRGPAPLLYVCDRLNRRIQVLDLDGTFVRTVGAGQLVGPTQMAVSGTTLVVTDLLAGRLSLFDGDDRLLGHLFPHPRPRSSWDDTADGWPNARSPEGLIVRAPLRAGAFHAPHGVTAAPDGTIYVSEFAIGGRIAVLRPSA